MCVLISYLGAFLFALLLTVPCGIEALELDADADGCSSAGWRLSHMAWFALTNVLMAPAFSPNRQSTCGMVAYSVTAAIAITLNVLVFAVVTAKFMVPRSSIVFHQRALLSRRNGKACLLIRIGNLRGNLLFFPEVRLTLHRLVRTAEGETYVAAEELDVSVPSAVSGAFTICHWISASSPLGDLVENRSSCGGLSLNPAAVADFTIAVAIKAFDDVLLADLTAYKKYGPGDFVFDKLFGDVLVTDARTGTLAVDFSLFDTLKDVAKDASATGPVAAGAASFYSGRALRPLPSPRRYTVPKTKDFDWALACEGSPRLVIVGGGVASAALGGDLVHVCSFSNSVIAAARLLGVPHTVVVVDLMEKPAWFLEVSKDGTTPVAYVGETDSFLQGSGEIESFLASDAGRAIDSELVGSLDMKMDVVMSVLSLAKRVKKSENGGVPCAFRFDDCAPLRRKLEAIERKLGETGGTFLLGGQEPTVEDVELMVACVFSVYLTSILAEEDDISFIAGLENFLRWAWAIQKMPVFDGLLSWPTPLIFGITNTSAFIDKFFGREHLSEGDVQLMFHKAAIFADINDDMASFFRKGGDASRHGVAPGVAPGVVAADALASAALQTTVSHCL